MVKIFFSDVAKKLGENVAEKCGEDIEKKLVKKISLFFNDNKSIN